MRRRFASKDKRNTDLHTDRVPFLGRWSVIADVVQATNAPWRGQSSIGAILKLRRRKDSSRLFVLEVMRSLRSASTLWRRGGESCGGGFNCLDRSKNVCWYAIIRGTQNPPKLVIVEIRLERGTQETIRSLDSDIERVPVLRSRDNEASDITRRQPLFHSGSRVGLWLDERKDVLLG